MSETSSPSERALAPAPDKWNVYRPAPERSGSLNDHSEQPSVQSFSPAGVVIDMAFACGLKNESGTWQHPATNGCRYHANSVSETSITLSVCAEARTPAPAAATFARPAPSKSCDCQRKAPVPRSDASSCTPGAPWSV